MKDTDLKMYSFYFDCGCMGDLDGVFFATPEEVKAAIGDRVYFGEVLGKHSEISGTLDADDVELHDIPPEDLAVLLRHRAAIESGHDPLSARYCHGCGDLGERLNLSGICPACALDRGQEGCHDRQEP
jgi:hypothetical protein